MRGAPCGLRPYKVRNPSIMKHCSFGEMLLIAMPATYGERKFIRTHAMPAESHASHPPIGCDSRTLQQIRTFQNNKNFPQEHPPHTK